MPVLEGQVALVRHIYLHRGLAHATKFNLVGLQQAFPSVVVETSLTEVFAIPVL